MKAISNRLTVFINSLWVLLALSQFIAHSAAAKGERVGGSSQKVIDFDDEVVEGLNKRPLDSLSQISERDKKRQKQHLYRKRASFRGEASKTLRLLRLNH